MPLLQLSPGVWLLLIEANIDSGAARVNGWPKSRNSCPPQLWGPLVTATLMLCVCHADSAAVFVWPRAKKGVF